MATKFARSSGDYENKVYDSGDMCKEYLHEGPGQDSKKFSKSNERPKDYSGMQGTKQVLKQTANPVKDSGEGMAKMSNEGGSTTDNYNPKGPRPKGNKASAPKRGDM